MKNTLTTLLICSTLVTATVWTRHALAFDFAYSPHTCFGKRPVDRRALRYTGQGIKNTTRRDAQILCYVMQDRTPPTNSSGEHVLQLTLKTRYRSGITQRPVRAWLTLYDANADRATGRSATGTLPTVIDPAYRDTLNVKLRYRAGGQTLSPTLRILLPAGAELYSLKLSNSI